MAVFALQGTSMGVSHDRCSNHHARKKNKEKNNKNNINLQMMETEISKNVTTHVILRKSKM